MHDFLLRSEDFEPSYLKLHRSGELERRAQFAIGSLASCCLCPRDCRVPRLSNRTSTCKTGRYVRVAHYFPHGGEEDCLRGRGGSGTIFFSWCCLRCGFCQNSDVSQEGHGEETRPQRLAEMMLELQAAGCHNINFVTPEHVVPQILEALVIAASAGLQLPLVYNSSGYDSLESLHYMDGVVDIYMPDFKIWDTHTALRYLQARDYPQAARRAIKEMHRQVGELRLDERGLAKHGVLLRHLVLPAGAAGTREIMRFVAREVSPDTYVNMMGQYYPANKVSGEKYPELNRRITAEEYEVALEAARGAGLHRFDAP
jgi:putative pyruvate formate lyase activating enzyme